MIYNDLSKNQLRAALISADAVAVQLRIDEGRSCDEKFWARYAACLERFSDKARRGRPARRPNTPPPPYPYLARTGA